MAPVCWSSRRPLGVAAKFSRLSNNVSSQMSLSQNQRGNQRENQSKLQHHVFTHNAFKITRFKHTQHQKLNWANSGEYSTKVIVCVCMQPHMFCSSWVDFPAAAPGTGVRTLSDRKLVQRLIRFIIIITQCMSVWTHLKSLTRVIHVILLCGRPKSSSLCFLYSRFN